MVNFALANLLVQRRVESAMQSRIQILRGSLGTLDEGTLLVGGMQSAATIYTGKAHVHNVQGAGVVSVGEGSIDTRTVQISIPIYAPVPRKDDLVKLISDNDPDLPNRVFRVMDVNAGGLLGAYHTMTCQGWFESRLWF